MQFLSEKAISGCFGTDSLKNLFLWTKSAKNANFAQKPFSGIGGFCAGISPVREIVREFAFLCGNFLKNLAMANFLLFWVNFGLLCVFRRFSEFLKEP